jgi:PKD repeat protein
VGNLNTTAFDTPGAANNCVSPLNDNCIGVGTAFSGFALTLGENFIPFSNAGAVTDAVPSSCGPTAGSDVWFNFTTPAGTAPSCAGDVTYSLCGSSFDTILTVYTGTACTSLTEIACNDDFAGCGVNSQVTIPAVAAATTHRIKVSGFGGATGDIVITVSHSAAPVNDNCDTPLVAIDGPNPFSTYCATNSGLNVGLPANNVILRDLWYVYTATCSGLLTVTTDQPLPLPTGTLTDTKLAIYAPGTLCPMSCGDLLGYDDDDGVSCSLCSLITNVPVVSGSTYIIRVGGFGTTTGIGVLNIACLPGPEECAGSTDVSEGVFAFDTTGLATNGVALDPLVCDMGPFGTEQIFNDLYYCYTASCNGTVQIDATGFDTRLAVYGDCTCPELATNVIACDDDTGSGGGFPFHAQVTFTATAGSSYLVRVGGFGAGDFGPGTLTIALPVANDECIAATPIFDGPNAGSTACATPSVDPIAGCTFTAANRDVWFSYSATCSGIVTVDLSGSGPPPSLNWDTVMVVYDGCGGPQVACDDDAGAVSSSLVSFIGVAGTDYRIRVGGFAAATTGSLAINVSCALPIPNDACVDAAPITGSGTFVVELSPPPAVTDGVDLTGACEVGNPAAGSGDGFPFGDNIIHHDVWYCYTPCVPPGQTATVSLTTLGAGFDTRLAVYGTCVCPVTALDLVACDDDTATAGAAPFEAAIPTMTMVGGTTYLIQVGTFSEADPTNIDCPLQITCTPDCVPPTAVFDATPTSGNAPATVVFTDSSTGTGPLTYSWDFDGDSVEDDNTQNPVFIYTTPGTYSATLTVSNFCGSSSASTSIQVCEPLAPAFSFTNTGLAEACASFTDLTTGDIAGWEWDFGNGDTSTAQNPSTTYPSAGTYTVTLTVTGSCGRIESTSQSLTVLAAGDCNADGSVNVTDPIYLAAYLFSGGPSSSCMSACEVNGDASLNLGDVVYELYYLFVGGAAPVPPAPCTACN